MKTVTNWSVIYTYYVTLFLYSLKNKCNLVRKILNLSIGFRVLLKAEKFCVNLPNNCFMDFVELF